MRPRNPNRTRMRMAFSAAFRGDDPNFENPRLNPVREERETNAQTTDYDRNRTELSFERLF